MTELKIHRLSLMSAIASTFVAMSFVHANEFGTTEGKSTSPSLLSSSGERWEISSCEDGMISDQDEFELTSDFTPAYSLLEPSSNFPADSVRQTVVQTIASRQPVSQKRDWQILPDGLMYHSYLAGPQEPRISAILFGDDDGGYFCDATVGGRIGFLRYGTESAKDPQGWQWDLEGAVMTRLNLLESEDVDSMDYRFGTLITWAEGPWAMKFGYFHISSHVGDEYQERNPTYRRVNYVTESAILGVSHQALEQLRLYGEVVFAVKYSEEAKRWQFQTGAEWTPAPRPSKKIAPFVAVNLGFRESTDYHMATTIQAGWGYLGPKSDRRLRWGLQYGDGPTSQFQFFSQNEQYLGWGLWFDY